MAIKSSGDRRTFLGNSNDYDNNSDFEANNRKFNKLASANEFKNQTNLTIKNSSQPKSHTTLRSESSPLYDKKRSFFYNLRETEQVHRATSYAHNHLKNRETFGNNVYQHYDNRSNDADGSRRPNNSCRSHQYGNKSFHSRKHTSSKKGDHHRC